MSQKRVQLQKTITNEDIEVEVRKPEKMSKSIDNLVNDDVVYGVTEVKRGFEFRYADGLIIEDYKAVGVWQNKDRDGFYYTSTQTGRQPVFLCEVGKEKVPMLTIKGEEKIQHGYLEALAEIVAIAQEDGLYDPPVNRSLGVICLLIIAVFG